MSFLLSENGEEFRSQVDSLWVVARCGCGACPTVLFGDSPDAEPITGPFDEIAQYAGTTPGGSFVSVSLLARNGQISELELSSLTGDSPDEWPDLNVLRRVSGNDV